MPLHFGVDRRFRSFRDEDIAGMDESIRDACSRNLIVTLSLMRAELYDRSRGAFQFVIFEELRSTDSWYYNTTIERF